MGSSESWRHYCEKIEHALETAEIKFDEVEVVQHRFATYLKIDGVDVSDTHESKEDTAFYSLPDDPDEAADLVVQELIGETE